MPPLLNDYYDKQSSFAQPSSLPFVPMQPAMFPTQEPPLPQAGDNTQNLLMNLLQTLQKSTQAQPIPLGNPETI